MGEKLVNTIKPYRPSNGTDGEIFMDRFCWHCTRHCETAPCEILHRSLIHGVDDDEYPKEWVKDERTGDPFCKAFTQKDPPDPHMVEERCEKTLDMFEQSKPERKVTT